MTKRETNQTAGCTWLGAAIAAIMLAGWAAAASADGEKPWDRKVAIGASATAGNTDTVTANGSLTGEKIWSRDELKLGMEGSYGESSADKTKQTGHLYGQYKRLFNERLYGTLIADVFHDDIADINYRLTLSPSLGYYFIRAEKTKLSGEVGPAFIREDLDGKYPRNYFTLRGAERFDHQFNDAVKVWQSFEIYPQVDDFGNFITITEVGLESKLTETLALRLVGRWRYDNEPPPHNEKSDFELITALSYKF